MSTISGMGAGNNWMMAQMMQKSSPSKMAESLFSNLDVTGKGYIEKSELQSALNQISGAGNTGPVDGVGKGASADEIFQKLDGNSDGKITINEMASGIEKLTASFNSQFNQSRMQGGLPAGHGGDKPDLSKEQLVSMSSDLASTDSQRANQMSRIAQNFEAADSNSDGKVSFQEAQTYDQTHPSTEVSSNAEDTKTSSNMDARILKQMFDLFQAYGSTDSSSSGSFLSALA